MSLKSQLYAAVIGAAFFAVGWLSGGADARELRHQVEILRHVVPDTHQCMALIARYETDRGCDLQIRCRGVDDAGVPDSFWMVTP